MPNDTFSDRVWRGDATTVGEARIAYLNDPNEDNLFHLAMVLYSLRHRADCAGYLAGLYDRLIPYAELWDRPDGSPEQIQQALDRADRLSTYLLWLSRQDLLGDEVCARALERAYEVAILALAVPGVAPHTRQLLQLTTVEAKLMEKDRLAASILLDEFERLCVPVDDANQQARILRKYGSLYRRIKWWRGTITIARSALLPGIAPMTRLKSLAALVGYRG